MGNEVPQPFIVDTTFPLEQTRLRVNRAIVAYLSYGVSAIQMSQNPVGKNRATEGSVHTHTMIGTGGSQLAHLVHD